MPALRRRQVLGGVASVGLGVTGAAVVVGRNLPESLEAILGGRHVPDVSPRPRVTSTHRKAAISSLVETVRRGEQLWTEVERRDAAVDDLPVLGQRERLDGARGALKAASSSDSGWKTLFEVRRGASLAGGAIGGARLALGRDDKQHLADESRSVRSNVERVRDRVNYEVDTPATGLAHLFWVEKRLVLATVTVSNEERSLEGDALQVENGDVDLVTAWQSLMEARRWLDDAGRLYEDFRASTGGQRSDLTRRVERADTSIESAAELLQPDPGTERRRSLDSLPSGPYRAILDEVHRAETEPTIHEPLGQDYTRGVALYRAIENAKALILFRAAADVRGHLPVDEESKSMESGLVNDARSRAVRRIRTRYRSTTERSLRRILLQRTEQLVRTGDSLRKNDDERTAPDARAWTRYRLAAEYVDRLPAVADRLDRPVEPKY